ncbi:MAG: TolC family outer membrane protein [Pseudomonadota bacterium]
MLRLSVRKGFAIVAATMSLSGPGASETLADALATAYRNSGLIAQNRAVLRAADEDVAQAVAVLRPVLNYVASADYVDGAPNDGFSASVGLSASMLLYDFGRSQLSVDAAKETVLATRQALVDIENTVLFNTVTAYLNVRTAEAFVDLRQNNVRLLTEQLRATRDQFEVGEVTRTDVSLAEAALAAARSGLAADQGSLAQARELYRVVVGQYPGTLAPPPPTPAVPDTQNSALDVARRNNPALLQVQGQVKAAELGVLIAQRLTRPTLNGTGGVTLDDDGDTVTSLGVQLSGPIYQGGAITSQLRQAQANRDSLRGLLFNTGLLVDQEVGNAYASLAVAIASIEASIQQVEAASLAFEGGREEFQLGARTTLDVLDLEQDLLDARTNLISARQDRQIATYQILDAMGLLTAEKMGLNVPIYDPKAYYNAVKDGPTHLVSPQGEKLDRVLKALGRN